MKKLYIILIAAVILAGIEYIFEFRSVLRRTEVQEALPSPSSSQGPRVVLSGTFGEVDAIHKGSGTAKIIQDGSKRYLRLEDFQVTNGPDLYVYLSESQNPTGDIKSLDKYISLGRLKGNVGNQNYEIPEPFQGYNTAVIWCQRFGVLFTFAVMK